MIKRKCRIGYAMGKSVRERGKTHRGFDRLLLFSGIAFLVVFLGAGCVLLQYYSRYREQKALDESIAGLRQVPGQSGKYSYGGGGTGSDQDLREAYERNAIRLKEANPDYIAWITVPGTDIYYPVVQRDNSYYLSHDFMQKVNSHGAIFMDESCKPDDGIILLHGHHMKDGTMFGGLKKFKRKTFRQEQDTIYLDWGEGDEPYRVFAVAMIDLTEEEYFHYNEFPETEEEREAYLKELKHNSLWFDSSGEMSGQIVLMSTCEYGTKQQRLVVGAVSTQSDEVPRIR